MLLRNHLDHALSALPPHVRLGYAQPSSNPFVVGLPVAKPISNGEAEPRLTADGEAETDNTKELSGETYSSYSFEQYGLLFPCKDDNEHLRGRPCVELLCSFGSHMRNCAP